MGLGICRDLNRFSGGLVRELAVFQCFFLLQKCVYQQLQGEYQPGFYRCLQVSQNSCANPISEPWLCYCALQLQFLKKLVDCFFVDNETVKERQNVSTVNAVKRCDEYAAAAAANGYGDSDTGFECVHRRTKWLVLTPTRRQQPVAVSPTSTIRPRSSRSL